jgi:hypothetical protein
MYIKVENNPSLVRDLQSNAILETDIAKLNRYVAMQEAMKSREDKIDMLIDRINKLEQIIERITNDNVNS